MKIDILLFTMDWYDDVFVLWQGCECIGLSEADSRDSIRAYLERNPGMSFVATSEGRVVGAVLAGHDGRRGYLHHLAVASNCRRQGLGRQLVSRSLAALADAGIQKCHLFVFNRNLDGIAFWQAAGWRLRADVQLISKTIEQASHE